MNQNLPARFALKNYMESQISLRAKLRHLRQTASDPSISILLNTHRTFPDNKQDDALIFLKRKGTELRQYVKKNGRFKFIPNIAFEIDYGERHRQHIDEITHQIENGKE